MTAAGETVDVTVPVNRTLLSPSGELTPIGLVIAEHVDKIAFFEPSVTVLEKEVLPSALRFTLRLAASASKPLDEIVAGFKIGCFKIAREYGLVTPGDATPLFPNNEGNKP